MLTNQSMSTNDAVLIARGIEPGLTTAEAASALRLAQQTLRRWAAYETGPIRPVRIGRRLVWSAADVRRLLEGGAS